MRLVHAVLATVALLACPVTSSHAQDRPVAGQSPAPALRAHLRWSGPGDLDLVAVTPDGGVVDATSSVELTASARTRDGSVGEWLEWGREPAPGRYLICATGDAGAGARAVLEVSRAGRTGRREIELSGVLPAVCTESSPGFLSGVMIGNQSSSEQSAPRCEDGRVAVDGGYCCWPGQRFDEAAGRCSGPPRCPAGFSAAGAECVRQQSASRPAAPAAPPRYGAPSYGSGASATVRLRSQQAGLSVHRLASTTSLTVVGTHGFAARGEMSEYALLARAPGTFEIPAGTYQLGVASGQGQPVQVGAPIELRGNMLLDVSYEDRSALRIVGWVGLVGGGVVAAALTTLAVMQDQMDTGVLVTGLVSGGLAMIVGFVLINFGDVARADVLEGRF